MQRTATGYVSLEGNGAPGNAGLVSTAPLQVQAATLQLPSVVKCCGHTEGWCSWCKSTVQCMKVRSQILSVVRSIASPPARVGFACTKPHRGVLKYLLNACTLVRKIALRTMITSIRKLLAITALGVPSWLRRAQASAIARGTLSRGPRTKSEPSNGAFRKEDVKRMGVESDDQLRLIEIKTR